MNVWLVSTHAGRDTIGVPALVFENIQAHLVSLHFADIVGFFFYKLKVCGNPALRSLGTTFPTAFLHFASLCLILVILPICETYIIINMIIKIIYYILNILYTIYYMKLYIIYIKIYIKVKIIIIFVMAICDQRSLM